MTVPQNKDTTSERQFRLWPGVVAACVQLLLRFVVPVVMPGALVVAMLGGVVFGLVIILWWVFFSRAPWFERIGAVILMVIALAATQPFLHESLATAGQGFLFYFYAVPWLCLAFVLWAVFCHRLPAWPRRLTMLAVILLSCGAWTLVKTGGVTGDFRSEFRWRWSQTPEERLLARSDQELRQTPRVPVLIHTEASWAGFRGPDRNGIVRGVRIGTDWSASPPVELWRRPVGPGWSSFAVGGGLVYTQEQRGDDEVVACYSMSSGEPVWRHSDPTRFYESNGGAGPRATPSLVDGRVYTLGATGIVNALDARDGRKVWTRDVVADTGAEVPQWGFSGSPLVVDDLVVVAAAGALVAYDLSTGEPRWTGPTSGGSYSSPQLASIAGITQVLLLTEAGVTSLAPADGSLLWEHRWPGYPIVQPALLTGGDLLISATEKSGLRRLAVGHEAQRWSVEERWTSLQLKPYFNDLVVHEGHAYGLDDRSLVCIDLATGARTWKGRRYGAGQLLLLADQGLLLVVSERGELALVRALPDQFSELARIPAVTGKTWNHPVVAGDLLLIRNSQEMVAYHMQTR